MAGIWYRFNICISEPKKTRMDLVFGVIVLRFAYVDNNGYIEGVFYISISPLTTFDLKPLILSLKLQRLQSLIISSHKCLRSQAYKTKGFRPLTSHYQQRHRDEVYYLPSKVEVLAWSAKTQIEMFKCGDHIIGVQGVVRRGSGSMLLLPQSGMKPGIIE
ncbi:gamma-glutamyl peptidase 5-like protein [Tanacetum coccineum]